MNNDEMEAAFNAMRLGHAGEAPDADSFRRAVWREIRHRKALGHSYESEDFRETWIANLSALFPRFVLAGLALAVGVAWATASMTESQLAPNDVAVTTHMLDLSVFGPHWEGLADDQLIVKR